MFIQTYRDTKAPTSANMREMAGWPHGSNDGPRLQESQRLIRGTPRPPQFPQWSDRYLTQCVVGAPP